MMPIVIMILAMGLMSTVGMNSNKDITLIMIISASMLVMMIATTQFQGYKNAPATIVVVKKRVNKITTILMIKIRRLHISWFPIVSICEWSNDNTDGNEYDGDNDDDEMSRRPKKSSIPALQ